MMSHACAQATLGVSSAFATATDVLAGEISTQGNFLMYSIEYTICAQVDSYIALLYIYIPNQSNKNTRPVHLRQVNSQN